METSKNHDKITKSQYDSESESTCQSLPIYATSKSLPKHPVVFSAEEIPYSRWGDFATISYFSSNATRPKGFYQNC